MTSISYKKLWYRLIDDNFSKTELRHATGISSSTLANMKNGKNVSLEVLLNICKFLHCTISNITGTGMVIPKIRNGLKRKYLCLSLGIGL